MRSVPCHRPPSHPEDSDLPVCLLILGRHTALEPKHHPKADNEVGKSELLGRNLGWGCIFPHVEINFQ